MTGPAQTWQAGFISGMENAATMVQGFRHQAETVPMETQRAWWHAWAAITAAIDTRRCGTCGVAGDVFNEHDKPTRCAHPDLAVRWSGSDAAA